MPIVVGVEGAGSDLEDNDVCSEERLALIYKLFDEIPHSIPASDISLEGESCWYSALLEMAAPFWEEFPAIFSDFDTDSCGSKIDQGVLDCKGQLSYVNPEPCQNLFSVDLKVFVMATGNRRELFRLEYGIEPDGRVSVLGSCFDRSVKLVYDLGGSERYGISVSIVRLDCSNHQNPGRKVFEGCELPANDDMVATCKVFEDILLPVWQMFDGMILRNLDHASKVFNSSGTALPSFITASLNFFGKCDRHSFTCRCSTQCRGDASASSSIDLGGQGLQRRELCQGSHVPCTCPSSLSFLQHVLQDTNTSLASFRR